MGRSDFHDRVRRIEKGQTRGPVDAPRDTGGSVFWAFALLLVFIGLGATARLFVDASGGVPGPSVLGDFDQVMGLPLMQQSGLGIAAIGALLLVLGLLTRRFFRMLAGVALAAAFFAAPLLDAYAPLLADVTALQAQSVQQASAAE